MANTVLPSDKREFRCHHCNGKILIPRELPPTTGPCPHCQGVITSPALEDSPTLSFPMPQAPMPTPGAPPPVSRESAPVPAVPTPVPSAPDPVPAASAPVPSVPVAAEPATHPATPPPPPSSVVPLPTAEPAPAAPPPSVIAEPQEAKLAEAPAGKTQIPEPRKKTLDLPHSENPSQANKPKPKATAEPEKKSSKKSLAGVLLVMILLLGGAATAVFFLTQEMQKTGPAPTPPPVAVDTAAKEATYLRIGWQKEAQQVLAAYMAGTTPKAKAPFILNGETMEPRLDDFYGGGVINDSDTPAEAFSIYELSEEDKKRGLFMMVYDQPPQFDMKEFFRPIAPLEVQYGIDEADLLLSTMARVGNFAMEPLSVHAFFKRTSTGLKLDWETFVQTKYRTFQNFVELPDVGQSAVFRILVIEDVPDKGHLEPGTRTYRMADPANRTDTARVNVKVDSEIGRTLSIINWRGMGDKRPEARTATVELKWTGENDDPDLEISRFICWEFLGLGGKDPTVSTASTN